MQDENNKPELKEGEEVTVWGAVGPNGQIVKSSVGIFKAVANRWALRRGNFEVVALGKIKMPTMSAEKRPNVTEDKPKRHREVRGPTARGTRGKRESLRREPSQKNA